MKDLHTHTVFSDGKDTPREMVEAAISRGMEKIGFSDHSYTAFDESYCIPRGKIAEYRRCVRALKKQYRKQITVLLGIEQDYWSETGVLGYDFVIGSVHYLKIGEEYVPVDESAETLRAAADRYFDGDVLCLAELYFETVADVVRKTHATIIGHFDLIKKHNGDGSLFDEDSPRYRAALLRALNKLLKTKVPFEINTGAVSRGYRTEPYPAPEWIEYIRAHGGSFVYSSDSHRADTLCYGFPEST